MKPYQAVFKLAVTCNFVVMGASQSNRQQLQRARTQEWAQGEVKVKLYVPPCVKDLSSARFNEAGFDLVLTELRQVR